MILTNSGNAASSLHLDNRTVDEHLITLLASLAQGAHAAEALWDLLDEDGVSGRWGLNPDDFQGIAWQLRQIQTLVTCNVPSDIRHAAEEKTGLPAW
jgi:hypothetical protein